MMLRHSEGKDLRETIRRTYQAK